MFFIVSTGRSGTTTIAKTLSLIDGCVCIHEPAPQLIIESSAYRYGTVDPDRIKSTLLATRPTHYHGSVYCESNQTLSLILPILTAAFPQARYIWLIRNGLDTVASAYQKQWYTGHSENHDRYEDCPPLQKAWVDGRIQGDRCGEVDPEQWQQLDRLGKCCWYWDYVNRIIETDLQTYAPNAYFTLRLEDFDVELPQLLRWMGLKSVIVPRVKRHNTAKREPFHWSEWTDHQRQTFEHWCGDRMDRIYPEWRNAKGDWQDIEYRVRTGWFAQLGDNYPLIQQVNRWFARNYAS